MAGREKMATWLQTVRDGFTYGGTAWKGYQGAGRGGGYLHGKAASVGHGELEPR